MSHVECILKIALCHPDAKLPKYVHVGDSGFDIHTVERTVLLPHSRKVLRTGLKFEMSLGFECQIRPRSGISAKTLLTVIEGTVDNGYRGEVGIIVHNTGSERIVIEKGERIAQGVICKVPNVIIMQIKEDSLTKTSRGDGGFGHTGM